MAKKKVCPMAPTEFKKFRIEMDWTWKTLAEQLGVCQRTAFFYANGTNPVPETISILIRNYRLMIAKGLGKYI